MTDCFEVAVPHEDIRRGEFDEAVFAANLADVEEGTAPEDYNDARTFFQKTYLTRGLEELLRQVEEKLVDGTGPGVVELQTPFGGGKTHSLVTVYHYLMNGERVSDFLPDGVGLIEDPSVAAVVGTQLNPSEGTTSGGVTRRTLWGEIAYQIGGEEAYREVSSNDQDRVAPGKADLESLLESHQPFVLLFDEILQYVVGARGVQVNEGTLGGQTLRFFNGLTEAVAKLPRGMMIATLPSSRMEDFGEAEQDNLNKLEHVIGRIESISTPVEDEEVHAIIRRRLFETVEDESAVRETVDQYFDKYQDHKDELPEKVRDADYRRRMEAAYPFHPDVINLLYEKWGTFSSFQRTRGVLRLLANVIEDLYESGRNRDLILPSDINLGKQKIRRELIKHIGYEYDSIIASDISGSDAKSAQMDRNRKGRRHLAERISTAIFLHSFTAGESQSGASLPYIKLAVLRPDTTASLVTEILQQRLSEELWYLNQRGEEYYFSNVPNLNRMVVDRKEVVEEERVRDELRRRIRDKLGSKLRTQLWPSSHDDLADNQDIKLAVLDPQARPEVEDLSDWVNRRGDNKRVYKNTVFFALPSVGRLGKMEDDIRSYLALQEIQAELEGEDRPGITERQKEAKRRLSDLEEDLPQRVRELYHTVAVPRADGELEAIDLGQPVVGRENLDTWYWNELRDPAHQKILDTAPSPGMIEAKFLGNGGPVSMANLREQFYKNPALPVPADDQYVAEAVAQGVEERTFGLVSRVGSELRPESLRFGESVVARSLDFRDDLMLVTAETAEELRQKEEEETEEDEEEGEVNGDGGGSDDGTQAGEENGEENGEDDETETVNRIAFRATGIPVNKLADLQRGVLHPLKRALDNQNYTFGIDIDIQSEEGVPKSILENQVRETLRQLGAVVEEEHAE